MSTDKKQMIRINNSIEIPADAFWFRASRSGGPGGQNVNKVNTRVTVFFDVAGSPFLADNQKKRLLTALSSRTDKNGVIRAVSQKHRTQRANREAATERLAGLMAQALRGKRSRRKTAVPHREKQKRLDRKKRRGELKRIRNTSSIDTDTL